MSRYWTLDDIAWDRFDSAGVDADILKIVKAASLVEHNAADYGVYLCNVFHDDPEFQAAARTWAEEEVQHGMALARWAKLADPGFDFAGSFKRFTDGYRLPVEASESVRGTRVGELVARCIVETGTSSYYAALGDAVREPVLKEICGRIAQDEVRHYKLFHTHLRRYLERERIGAWRRLWVALRRIGESEDDELAYAYYAANDGVSQYDRRRCAGAYLSRALRLYRRSHMRQIVTMVLRAVGIKPRGAVREVLSWMALGFARVRAIRLARVAG